MTSNTEITNYGDLVPGYQLLKKVHEQLGVSYIISDGSIGIFSFKDKPISIGRYLEIETPIAESKGLDSPCYTGWTYRANLATAGFVFTPAVGFKLYNAIAASGWGVENLIEKKRYDELDQSVYIFNLAGKLLENKEG